MNSSSDSPPRPTPVLLVGHCGPDSSYLRIAAQKALPSHPTRLVHDDGALEAEVTASPEAILLVNRVLEPGFSTESGVELISQMKSRHPRVRMLLVSNYDDAQEAAERAGALPGFGKRDIGGRKLVEALQNAAR